MNNNGSFKEISARVVGFVYSPNHFLLVRAPTGSGKTTNVLKKINEFGDLKWIYVSPFHINVDEHLKMSVFGHYDYTHLKSRAKTCIVDRWRELAAQHINIRPICENKCELRETNCPYYSAKRQLYENPGNWAGVHHHLTDFMSNFLDSYSLENPRRKMSSVYDLIIIDENPIQVFFFNEKTDKKKLMELRALIKKLNLSGKNVDNFVKFLNYLIIGWKDGVDYDDLYKLIHDVNFDKLYEYYQVELLEALVSKQLTEKDIPKEYIKWFGKIERYGSREKLEDMIVLKDKSGYTHKHYYLMYFEEDGLKKIPFKIIGLDGTANIEIWETLVGCKASVFDRKYDYKNMYQLVEGEYPLSSWLKPITFKLRNTGKKLCGLIDLIASKKKYKVLVICTKALEEKIRNNTKAKNLIYGNYYYLRSRSDFYKVADTFILAIQPNVPEFQLECFARLSNWDIETWRKVFTDEEEIQGAGRSRENLTVVSETKRKREPVEIYVFPAPRHVECRSEIIDVFPEAKKVTYYELIEILEDRCTDDRNQLVLDLIPENGISIHDLYGQFIEQSKCRWSSYKFKFDILSELIKQGVINEPTTSRGKIRKVS